MRQTRQIKTFDATMLVVGSMIGSGIFIVSADTAQLTGSAAGLLIAWSLAGLLTMLAATHVAELATMLPQAGGPFAYFREAYGPGAAFLFAWTTFLVVQSGTIAAVAAAFAKFLGLFVVSLAAPWDRLIAVGVIAVLTLANARGLRTGTSIQNVLTLVKYAALLALTLGGLLWSGVVALPATLAPAAGAVTPPMVAEFSLLAFAAAMVGPLFSQSAWFNVTFPAGEVENPARVFPRALIGGCALVAVLYVITNIGYLNLLGLHGIATAPSQRVGSAAAEVLMPGLGGSLMAAAISVSTFGCVNGLVLSGARVVYAAARARMFFAPFGKLNQAQVPAAALAVQAVWCSVLVLSGSYSQLLRYVISAELLIVILMVAAVAVLRRRLPNAPRPFRTWGYPWTSALFIGLSGAVMVLLAMARPETAWPGYIIVLAGVPAYLWLRRAGGV